MPPLRIDIIFHLMITSMMAWGSEVTTDWPEYQVEKSKGAHHYSQSGAARQIFGSGSIRPPDINYSAATNKAKQRFEKENSASDGGGGAGNNGRPPLPQGTVLFREPKRPGKSPPIVALDPSNIGLRLLGKGNQNSDSGGILGSGASMGAGHAQDLYGPRNIGGKWDYERAGWRPPYQHSMKNGHGEVFKPNADVFVSEDDLWSHRGGNAGGSHTCDLVCEPTEFFCPSTCACIHADLRCDGQADCEIMNEDEQECFESEDTIKRYRSECESTGVHVMCPTTYKCISRKWLCDGDDDCDDYSDETHCGSRRNCTHDQFECHNGLCIPNSWLCDGDNDCKDFSDELNCTIRCTHDEFVCTDGTCVSSAFRCDNEVDCSDGSDEEGCDQRLPNCPEGEFKCRGSVGGMAGPGNRCVLQRYRCDGDNDCGDWSDEENCPKKLISCTSNEFRCDDGTCIPNRWRCDKEQDCDGSEDEKGCTNVAKNRSKTCTGDDYTCKDGRCILRTWVCDGIADCKRGEDEIDCDLKCEIGQFACGQKKNTSREKTCIGQKYVCDQNNDCPDGEDEVNCPITHSCNPYTRCEQLCVTAHQGQEECACGVGFTLAPNKLNCTDIDECQYTNKPVCSQKCINTHGSFRCSCLTGYILRPDLRSCKALGGAVKLIMANRADIRQVSLSNNKYTSIIKGLPNAISVDYHFKKDLLFWSDVSTDVIRKSNFNGSGVRDVIKWGLESPGGIAIDWIHDLLFWTDSGTRRVEVSTFDGNLRVVIAVNDLDKPRAIVVHPGEAMVFWTDWGPSPKIERSYMDGSERRVIIVEGIFWPNGLTLDYTTNRLYWADAKHHVIESSKLDGSDRKKVLSSNLPHPFAITVFEDSMFWTDWHTKTISMANKITGKGVRFVHEGLHFPMDLHSYHPARQPNFSNRCAADRFGMKGGCSHLCLPSRTLRKCSCPIGLTLKDDGKTCTSDPDKILLVARKKDIRIRQLDTKDSAREIDMVIPLDGLKSTVALDWCSQTNVIYWTDVGKGAISRAYLNGSDQEVIVHSNLVEPAGLALDWVTTKLYWTDSGTKRIEVAGIDGKQRAILIWKNLDKPRDIVLNPVEGFMFWSDWGPNAVISRAGMDGSSHIPIVSENLLWPNGLAIDNANHRLYFLDGGTKTIEFVNFDGTARNRLISEGLNHVFGLDLYGKKIFWTDWGTQSVHVADKLTGKNRRVIISNTTDLMDIRVFHRERKDIRNPCGTRNGECSHICLLNPSGYTCACPIGVTLTIDNKTCHSGPSRYIVFAHRLDIRRVSLDIDYMVDVVLPLPVLVNVVSLDVDTLTGDLFYADTVEDVLMRSSMDGMNVKQIFSESMDSVDGLVIDSIGRKIYWTDAGRHSIEVSELDGSHRSVLISQDLESPRGIGIDYNEGVVYWSDWGLKPRIERADMDGGRRARVVTTNLGWPNGIALDKIGRKIFWTDAHLSHIETCDYNGNFRRVVIKDLPHPYGLAVANGKLYWTDWKTESLHVTDKEKATVVNVVTDKLQGLMDIKIIEHVEDPPENKCGRNNGGCSHLCLRKPGGYSCKCPTGIRMRPNSVTECESLPNSYLLIALRSGIGRISLDTPEYFDVVLPIEGIHGAVVVDYHYNQSFLFYADVNIDAIRRIDMKDFSQAQTLVSTGLNTPNGIAVDWLANNLYWTDTSVKAIEVSRLDGSSRKAIHRDNLDDPRSIILYPKRGYVFWADWGQTSRIERCFMDGSDRRTIVDSELGFPTGLAIDFDQRKLYWADALQDKIQCSDFHGKNRLNIISQISHPFGFTLTNSYYYWTDWYNKSVIRAPRSSGTVKAEEIRRGLRGALEIRSVSAERQPIDWNPCGQDNGGCTHLCLFKDTSYVCACPDTPDSKICRTEPAFNVPIKRPGGKDDVSEYTDEVTQPTEIYEDKKKKDKQRYQTPLIIASFLLLVLIIAVIVALFMLLCGSHKKKSEETLQEENRLTFSNPNYNNGSGSDRFECTEPPTSSKNTLWRRIKYEKNTERVYEEKSLSNSEAVTSLILPVNPSPMPSPLSTIG